MVDTKLVRSQHCILTLLAPAILYIFVLEVFSCLSETFHVIFSSILAKIYHMLLLTSWLREEQPHHQKGLSLMLFHLFLTQLVSCKSMMLPPWSPCNADPKQYKHMNQNICKYNRSGREVIMLQTDQKMSFIVKLRILQFKRN